MTKIKMTVLQHKVKQKREIFADTVKKFGLTASTGESGCYSRDGKFYRVIFQTEQQPAKGQKKLIESIKAAGFCVNKYYTLDKFWQKSMVFRASSMYVIECGPNDADEYKEA